MHLRKLVLAVGLAGALGSELASALGLGEITLHSTLNQPLSAEIKLLEVRDLSPTEVLVNLASTAEFTKAGIDRPYVLGDLVFSVLLDNPGGPVIRVTSKNPIREPYLNFLLETQWPNGRLLREYTLLMDLPVFTDSSVKPVAAATASPRQAPAPRPPAYAAPASRSERQATSPRPPVETPSPAGYSNSGDGSYTVGKNDTLWNIALNVRPSRNFTVQQTMVAIQQLNPDAFVDGNINRLRNGKVLRIPDADQISSFSRVEAVNEVAQQNAEWSGKPAPITGPQLDASNRSSESEPVSTEVQGRLKLASGSTASASGSEGASGSGAGLNDLRNQLSSSQEELDRSRRENSELKGRISELEDQIQTMERLVEVSNEQLRALQLAAGSADSTDVAAESTPATSEMAAAAKASIDAKPATSDTDQSAQLKSAPSKPESPKPAAKPDASKQVVSVAPAPAKQSLLDLVMENIAYIGAGAAALILGLLLALRQRAARKAEDEPFSLEEIAPQSFAEPAATDETAASVFAEVADDAMHSLETEASVATEPAEIEEAPATTDTESVEPATADVVSEADIYVAYGKLEQAEEILTKALKRAPDNTEARLKLMEVHAEQKNLEAFDQQFALIQDDPSAVKRGNDLRAQFSNAPAFAATGVAAGIAAMAAVKAFEETDFEETSLEETEKTDSFEIEPAADSLDDDTTLDFNLSDFDIDAGPASTESTTDSASGNSLLDEEIGEEMDFTLDLSDLAEEDSGVDFDFSFSSDDELGKAGDTAEGDVESGDATDFSFDFADEVEASSTTDSDSLSLDLADQENAELVNDFSISFDLSDLDVGDTGAELDFGGELSLDNEDNSVPALSLDDVANDMAVDFSGTTADEAADSLLDVENQPLTSGFSDSAAETVSVAEDFDFDAVDLSADLEALDSEVDALAANIETPDTLLTDADESDLDFSTATADISEELDALSDLSVAPDAAVGTDDAFTEAFDTEAFNTDSFNTETFNESADEMPAGVSAEETADFSLESDSIESVQADPLESEFSPAFDTSANTADLGDFTLTDEVDADANLTPEADLIADEAPFAESTFDLGDDPLEWAPADSTPTMSETPDTTADLPTSDLVADADIVDVDPIQETDGFELSGDTESDFSFDAAESDFNADFTAEATADTDSESPSADADELSLADEFSLEDALTASDSVSSEPEFTEVAFDTDNNSSLQNESDNEPENLAGTDDTAFAPELDMAAAEDFSAQPDEFDTAEPVAPTLDLSGSDAPQLSPAADSEDSVFEEALADFPSSTAEDLDADFDLSDELDSELDFLADSDEAATKLDLARAYIDMGDSEGARDILSEVLEEGTETQIQEAEALLSRLA